MLKKELVLSYLALAAVCIIWGTTYLALRIGVLNFPPFLFTLLRQLIAGGILVIFAFVFTRAKLPTSGYLLRQAIGGFFMISLGNGLVAWAEMYIPSGVAAIICSLMPLVVVLINLAIQREEKTNAFIVSGVTLGFLGIMLIFSEHIGEFSRIEYLVGILFTFVAVLAWAGGSIWIKKKNNETNLFLNAGLQMFFGGLWLLPISFAFDDYSKIAFTSGAVYPFIYLVIFGSIVAYVSYSYVLRQLPITIVSLYAYINPLVAVLLGWVILNEKLNMKIMLAFLITVAGIYLVNKGHQQLKQLKPALSDS